MRLWSFHPKYLDSQGLVAVWREALLAQKVLENRTRGYRNHPQLFRFRETRNPLAAIAKYLEYVFAEASRRGYAFDAGKIRHLPMWRGIEETRGQIRFEWNHYRKKLWKRNRRTWVEFLGVQRPSAHPLFEIVQGDVRPWEKR